MYIWRKRKKEKEKEKKWQGQRIRSNNETIFKRFPFLIIYHSSRFLEPIARASFEISRKYPVKSRGLQKEWRSEPLRVNRSFPRSNRVVFFPPTKPRTRRITFSFIPRCVIQHETTTATGDDAGLYLVHARSFTPIYYLASREAG